MQKKHGRRVGITACEPITQTRSGQASLQKNALAFTFFFSPKIPQTLKMQGQWRNIMRNKGQEGDCELKGGTKSPRVVSPHFSFSWGLMVLLGMSLPKCEAQKNILQMSCHTHHKPYYKKMTQESIHKEKQNTHRHLKVCGPLDHPSQEQIGAISNRMQGESQLIPATVWVFFSRDEPSFFHGWPHMFTFTGLFFSRKIPSNSVESQSEQ